MTIATRDPEALALYVGTFVHTPHDHRGRCQSWSHCDGAQVSRVTGLHPTTATVVTACGLVQILYRDGLRAA